MLIILFVVSIFAISTNASASKKNQGTADKSLEDTFLKIAGLAGSPELSATLAVLQSFKTESSSTISNINQGVGFKSIYNRIQHNSGDISKQSIGKLFQHLLKDDAFVEIADIYKKIITRTIEEYAFICDEGEFKKQEFSISYENGKGMMYYIVMSLSPSPLVKDAIRYMYYITSSLFEPAQPYVVITHSDCNILSCNRADQIVFLPATITDAHMKSLVDINIKLVLEFSRNAHNLLS